jgi:hypothetical protein
MKSSTREAIASARASTPVFIVGAPRSGTTLLYRTLLRHSRFRPEAANPVSTLVETKIFQDFSERNPALLLYMYNDQEAYGRYLEATKWLRARNRLMERTTGVYSRHLLGPAGRARLWRALGHDRLVQLYFYHARVARRCARLVEKTPQHQAHIPEIVATFPRASFLWIHRHPIDVFSSYRRRAGSEERDAHRPQAAQRWMNVSPQEFCRRYRFAVANCRGAMQDPAVPMHRVSYEEFVARPEQTFRAVCEFLDEPFEPECVTAAHAEVQDPRDPLLSSRIQTQTKDWQKYVEEDEARTIEDALGDEMSCLGYAAYTR